MPGNTGETVCYGNAVVRPNGLATKDKTEKIMEELYCLEM